MPDYTQPSQPEAPFPDITRRRPALPHWLARKLLRQDEEITWVRGPRLQPWWERFVTHPMLFVDALVVGAAIVVAGRLSAGSWNATPPACFIVAAGLFFGSIYVLAIFSACFTRLVVTTQRLLIVQGREVCRAWSIDRLPHSLRRYRMHGDVGPKWAVDVEALKTMIGSDQFSDAKTLRAFGKQLDQIQAREDGRR
jgi:hypothetical protein